MRPSADPHASRMWDVFGSPIEGVVWDSGRHCWIAQPILENVPPQYFAPAVLGMEGAKAEAIRQRKSMEIEAGMETSRSDVMLDQPKQALISMQPPPRRGGSSPAAEENHGRLQSQRSPNARSPPVRSPPRVQSRTQSPQQSRSPVPAAGNTQRLPPRTNSAPRIARLGQPRQSAGRITMVTHEKVVDRSSRDNSPVVRDARHAGGREGSPVSFSGARRNYSPLTGRREGESKQTREPHRRDNAARRQDVRQRETGRTMPKQVERQVMQQLQQLQSKVEQMQEEASRERSEKEELKRENERMRLQVDKLLKVASFRIGRLDESDAIQEVEAFDSRVLASLRSSQCGSANDTDSVASSSAAQDVTMLTAILRNSHSRDSCETDSLGSSIQASQYMKATPVKLDEELATDSAVHCTVQSLPSSLEAPTRSSLPSSLEAPTLPSSLEAPTRSAAKKKPYPDSSLAGRSLSLGSRAAGTSKAGLQVRANVARSCDALRREPEVSDPPGSPSRTPGSPNGTLSGRVLPLSSPSRGWRANGGALSS